jgi:hypothetical protein
MMINYLDQLWRVLLLLLLLLSLSHVIDNITVELASHSSTANSLGGALKRGGEGMNPSKSQKALWHEVDGKTVSLTPRGLLRP